VTKDGTKSISKRGFLNGKRHLRGISIRIARGKEISENGDFLSSASHSFDDSGFEPGSKAAIFEAELRCGKTYLVHGRSRLAGEQLGSR